MLYKINNKYYILVDCKYVSVEFDIKGNNVSLKPNRKDFIEKNPSIEFEEITFNDEFKSKIIKSNSKEDKISKDNSKVKNTRYNKR